MPFAQTCFSVASSLSQDGVLMRCCLGGPVWGSLEENWPDLSENAGSPSGNRKPQSLPQLATAVAKGEREHPSVPSVAFRSLRNVEMVVMRWKCWDSGLGLICNNGNFSDSNAGVEVVDRGSLGNHL